MVAYEKFNNGEMSDYIPTDADLEQGFAGLPKVNEPRNRTNRSAPTGFPGRGAFFYMVRCDGKDFGRTTMGQGNPMPPLGDIIQRDCRRRGENPAYVGSRNVSTPISSLRVYHREERGATSTPALWAAC